MDTKMQCYQWRLGKRGRRDRKKGKLEGEVYEVMEAKETNYFQKKGVAVSFEYC